MTKTQAQAELEALLSTLSQDAERLIASLDRLSDFHWGEDGGDCPLFRTTPSVLEFLTEVEQRIDTPLCELRSAA